MSRLLLSTLTLSALLVYAPVSSAQMGPPPAVADVTYEAARLSGQGNYHEAVALCRQALQKWPDQPTLLTCIGDALTNKGAYPEAVENYEKARLSPVARGYLGESFLRLHGSEQAR